MTLNKSDMIEELNGIRRRIKQLLADQRTTVNRIAAGDGAVQRRIQRQVTEEVSISVETLLTLAKAFPGLSMQWLVSGIGKPFDDPAESSNFITYRNADVAETDSNGLSFDEENVIPVYSVEASANLNTLALDTPINEIVGRVSVPNMPRCDGATYVRGDSMYPLLQSGDLIGFKIMPVTTESIFFGEIYLLTLDVEGDRYLTVKYIYRSDRGPDHITLVSANPNHQPKEIHLSAVKGLALVKFTIRMNSML